MDTRSKSAMALDSSKQKFEPYRSAVKTKNLTSMNHWDLSELRKNSNRQLSDGPMPPKLHEYFARKSVGSTERSTKPYVLLNNPKRKITPLRNSNSRSSNTCMVHNKVRDLSN